MEIVLDQMTGMNDFNDLAEAANSWLLLEEISITEIGTFFLDAVRTCLQNTTE